MGDGAAHRVSARAHPRLYPSMRLRASGTPFLACREVAHRILIFVHVNCVSHLSRPGVSIDALLLGEARVRSAHHLECRPLQPQLFNRRLNPPGPHEVAKFRALVPFSVANNQASVSFFFTHGNHLFLWKLDRSPSVGLVTRDAHL